MAGWTVTLLEKGRVLRIELTVSGARCRKSETLASPLPSTDATHSTLDTEPAAGAGCEDMFCPGSEALIRFLARYEKNTYEATQAGETNSEAF